MTTDRLPTFTPTAEYRVYEVTLLCDRWDTNLGKLTVTVYAIGIVNARQVAVDLVRDRYPDATAVHVEEVVADTRYHDECGYLWDLHDNKVAGRTLPFGCPSEAEVREEWGDR